jgi:hypothetical protein
MSKLINIQNRYSIKRKIPLSSLYGVTLSKN